MSLNVTTSNEDKKIHIAIDGRFDFSLHQEFRDAYINHNKHEVVYVLELINTTYMDSSALGMILLLKDHADSHAGEVIINKPSEAVYKILEIAQFHRLMAITM